MDSYKDTAIHAAVQTHIQRSAGSIQTFQDTPVYPRADTGIPLPACASVHASGDTCIHPSANANACLPGNTRLNAHGTPNIYLVRHTSIAIKSGICYGQLDVEVGASFVEEASRIREKLANLSFARIFSSPLRRCVLLATALGKEAILDPRLMEMHFGIWEGQAWESVFATDTGKKWFENYLETPCPQGESFNGLSARVSQFTQEKLGSGGPSLIITHGGVIRAMLVILQLADAQKVFDISIPYGQIIRIANGQYSFV